MDYDIKKLQETELELLKELDRVCKANDIPYYLAAGSCIGAVRHKGFIPWDDDIDVFMYADDADRLFQHREEFGENFFLQNAEVDPGYNLPIARLRRNGTALVEPYEADADCHHGIFLDIYLLYYFPDKRFLQAKLVFQGIKRNILLAGRPPMNHGALVKAVGKLVLAPYRNEARREKAISRLTAAIRKYHDTEELVILFGMDISLKRIIRYRAEWFGKPGSARFEGMDVPVATDADAYLKCRYGEDYMVLPPEEKRHSYHNFYFVSFTEEYKPQA